MKIKISGISDRGKERISNEDAICMCPDLSNQSWEMLSMQSYISLSPLGSVMIVADGMGGANHGEIASSLAIQSVKDYFSQQTIRENTLSDDSILHFLNDSICVANKAIINEANTNLESEGLGTTIVVTWIIHNKIYVAWCGDSRCYCFNPQKGLKLLTKDHSYVQELVDQKVITEKQAFYRDDNNIITRCLGDVSVSPDPESRIFDITNGDMFLVCTDGLHSYCQTSEIEKVLIKYYDNIDHCRDQLLNIALNAGGGDNITIALCSVISNNLNAPSVSIPTRIKRLFLS